MKKTAWLSLILSLLAVFPSAISGIGLPIIFVSQIVGGFAMAAGRVYICSISALIAIINLEFISIFSSSHSVLSPSSLTWGLILLLPQLIGYTFFLRRRANTEKNTDMHS
jgi:uncharacterized membrane-anchored protein